MGALPECGKERKGPYNTTDCQGQNHRGGEKALERGRGMFFRSNENSEHGAAKAKVTCQLGKEKGRGKGKRNQLTLRGADGSQ